MLWQLLPKGMESWDDGFAVFASDPHHVRLGTVSKALSDARNASSSLSRSARAQLSSRLETQHYPPYHRTICHRPTFGKRLPCQREYDSLDGVHFSQS
ncbi:hypothetical protein MPTK1_8g06330 [Marchantia polymorpha subsp. ruderalis]|uniref:Uncharacterized protein n=1 Tax=Marchantia polymorpha TaxID=3197 RepID=A0A2R6XIL7_MARPO|nr:hypothetical protein MARPO_0013s0157 [Marchantia polymorpha]BBN18886.1 hypothetical protein Mp_8g06330 [Marchantia polymorpha subsp. ruderalis]|eukprot:PTQ45958.1 hypothetical protein MARPO_0013s0157 [Marchantia polymorpha]